MKWQYASNRAVIIYLLRATLCMMPFFLLCVYLYSHYVFFLTVFSVTYVFMSIIFFNRVRHIKYYISEEFILVSKGKMFLTRFKMKTDTITHVTFYQSPLQRIFFLGSAKLYSPGAVLTVPFCRKLDYEKIENIIRG